MGLRACRCQVSSFSEFVDEPGRDPNFLFLPSQQSANADQRNHVVCRLARPKSKTRPRRWAPDARMSLCTYCHTRLARETQAQFDLFTLFTPCADHGRSTG